MTALTKEQLTALTTLEVVHEVTGWPYETIMKLLILQKKKELIKSQDSGLNRSQNK